MSGPAALDLVIQQGDGYRAEIRFVDGAGAPYSVAGASWLAQIRRRRDASGPLVAAFTFDLADAAAGVVRISLPAAATALLPATAEWDLERTPAGGAPATLLAGTVTSPRDVTRGALPSGTPGGDVFTVALTPTVTVVTTGSVGPPGVAYGNIDGGRADTNFGGMIPLDAGGAP